MFSLSPYSVVWVHERTHSASLLLLHLWWASRCVSLLSSRQWFWAIKATQVFHYASEPWSRSSDRTPVVSSNSACAARGFILTAETLNPEPGRSLRPPPARHALMDDGEFLHRRWRMNAKLPVDLVPKLMGSGCCYKLPTLLQRPACWRQQMKREAKHWAALCVRRWEMTSQWYLNDYY